MHRPRSRDPYQRAGIATSSSTPLGTLRRHWKKADKTHASRPVGKGGEQALLFIKHNGTLMKMESCLLGTAKKSQQHQPFILYPVKKINKKTKTKTNIVNKGGWNKDSFRNMKADGPYC